MSLLLMLTGISNPDMLPGNSVDTVEVMAESDSVIAADSSEKAVPNNSYGENIDNSEKESANKTDQEFQDSSDDSSPDINETLIRNPVYEDFKGQAMITFSYDDGWNSIYEYALPLHEKYGIPATFNIIARMVVEEKFHSQYFSPEKVIDSAKRGIEIASHSYYHDIALTEKTDEEIHFELSESKKILSELAGDVETFAVPYSLYDDRVKNIAEQYYRGVRVFGQKLNNIPPDDVYRLYSAVAVTNKTTFEEVKQKIDEAVNKKKWIIIMFHGINPKKETYYEITPELLEQIMEYVSSFDKDYLLPINTRDALLFMEKYYMNKQQFTQQE